MSKIKLDNKETQLNADRILKLTGTAIKDLKELASTFDNFQKSVDRSKKADAENAARVEKAKTEAQKEENRHSAAMAKIELEYEKLKKNSEKGEFKLTMVNDMVQMIKGESDKLLSLNTEQFLSKEASESRNHLHKTMVEITKELLR